MLKHFTLAAILLAATAPLAHAQDTSDDYGDRWERADKMNDPDDDGGRMRDMRHGDRWARHHDDDRMERRMKDRGPGDKPGPRGPRGPDERRGPPPPPKAGFEIRMGPGQSIRVDCGEETFSDCVEAAQPILDAMSSMPQAPRGDAMGPAGDMVPPPPRELVDPATAGDEADAPPPPPNGDTPEADTAPSTPAN